ncbi:DUF4872 domain-containing protein [Glutamicibacter sp.]|uniref:DUF4872 domain-containing protein n=1 Tax=Glutamicibacter sp. TaxID=1931995 RepID=UPI0028BE16FE|nr:DUF4872 domain-containing protein [Glutamicibacter sp.]
MVQPKNLKKLTRERMERTGESYTTARKNIMTNKPESPKAARAAAARNYGKEAAQKAKAPAPAAAAAPKQAPKQEELPEYPAPENVMQYDAALWHRVFTQAGVVNPVTGQPFTEAMLAGLAGGIGFMQHSFVDQDEVSVALITRAHPEPYTQNLLTRSGAKLLERTTSSPIRAAEYLDAGLDAGRAVVVRVAVNALPWIDADQVDEADTIDLAVVGDYEDDLLVDDGSGSLNAISPEDLSAARAKRKKEKFWQAWVVSRRSPKSEALAANVLDAISETTARLLGTSQMRGIPAHFAKNFGVAGMRTFAARLRDSEGKTGWAQLFAEDAQREQALEQLAGFLADTRFGGIGGLRGQYADFLDEAAELPGLEALGEHAASYAALAALWIDFSQLLFAELEPADLFNALAGALEQIADAEEHSAAALAETVAALRA